MNICIGLSDMTKKILVIGLTERMGGVETFIYNTTRFSNKEIYEYDFLVHGSNHVVFQKEIMNFYNDGKQHFFFVPSIKKQPVASLKALSRFYKQNAYKYDFIHLETGATSEIMYVYPFIKKYNLKVITHSHNGNGYSPMINAIFRPLVNQASIKELSCSKEATDWLFGKRRENNVVTINNGIDTERFTFNLNKRKKVRKKYHIADDTLVIGHIGRFSEQKNHKFLLKIYKKVLDLEPNSCLLLVGTGELLDEIKREIFKLGSDDKVILCGLQSMTEDFYSAFDVFLMPSLYEGLPVVGVEAQCEGLPALFSDSIDPKINITDNAHFLSLDKDVLTWAKCVLKFKEVNDRAQYAKLIEEKGFSINCTVKQLEKVYED